MVLASEYFVTFLSGGRAGCFCIISAMYALNATMPYSSKLQIHDWRDRGCQERILASAVDCILATSHNCDNNLTKKLLFAFVLFAFASECKDVMRQVQAASL